MLVCYLILKSFAFYIHCFWNACTCKIN